MNSSGLLTAWRIWDQIYYHCTRLKYVDKENRNLFRVVVKRYGGEPLVTSDGVSLKKGDWYAKLHLHNCLFAQMIREQSLEGISLALFTVNSIRGSLPPWPGTWRIIPARRRFRSCWGPPSCTGEPSD